MDETKYSVWCPTGGLGSVNPARDQEPNSIPGDLNSSLQREPPDSNTSRPRREHREVKRQTGASPIQQASKEKLYKVHWGRTTTKGPSVGTSTSSPITEHAPHSRPKASSAVRRKEIPHELDSHAVKASIPLFPGFGPREPPPRRRRSTSMAAVLSDTRHNVSSSSTRRRGSIGQSGNLSKAENSSNRAISLDKGAPSVISLVSGVTGVSHSSSGSDSTITQKRFLLSQQRNAGRAHAAELPPTSSSSSLPSKPSGKDSPIPQTTKKMVDKPSVFSYLDEGSEQHPTVGAASKDDPDLLPMNEPYSVHRHVDKDVIESELFRHSQGRGPLRPRSRPLSHAEPTASDENPQAEEHAPESCPHHDFHSHHHEHMPADFQTGPLPGSYFHSPHSPAQPPFDPSSIPLAYRTNIDPANYPNHSHAPAAPQPHSPHFVSSRGISLPAFVARPPSPTRSMSPDTSGEAKNEISGYELLASKLSQDHDGSRISASFHNISNEHKASSASAHALTAREGSLGGKQNSLLPRLPPLYRKFETLNHRIFLHLQDEIAELEEDLRRIDEADAQARRFAAGYDNSESIPSSRRADAKLLGELQMSRIDVLGRAFVKIGQYNSALASYTTLLKSLDPAKSDDIKSYQSWMAEHNPIVPREARFLSHEADLLSIPSFFHHSHRRHQSHHGDQGSASGTQFDENNSHHRGDARRRHSSRSKSLADVDPDLDPKATAETLDKLTPFQRTIITLLAALLLPLFVFNLVSEFLGRLVVAASIAGAVIAIITPARVGEFLPAGRGWNWGVSVAAYAGVFVVAAGVA